jgi:pimeloyl-ACP methyl ester carboxylesterase
MHNIHQVINIYIQVDDIKVYYIEKGSGKTIIFLHGWGQTKETYNRLMEELADRYKVIAIDLPGFGETEIGLPMDLNMVSEVIHKFVLMKNIVSPIFLSHSYGTRIMAVYASKYNVSRLIIVSGAGIKQKVSVKNRIKIKMYKMLKKHNIILKMGSSDYINSDNVKKSMLVNAINTDLTKELKLIEAPTLLIYGRDDKVTPLSLGYKMKEFIKNSELIIMENCSHFPYLEKPTIFNLILNSFLSSDDL